MIRKRIKLSSFLLLLLFILILPYTSCLSTEIFDDIFTSISTVRDKDIIPIVIFDLDGTLYNNGPRSKQIFLDFAEQTNDSDLTEIITLIDSKSMKYKVRESLIDVGITDSTILSGLMRFWKSKFFSNDYLNYDVPLPGAVEFVNELHDSGALIIYLTGRDAPGTLEGTVSSLKDNGYPIGIIGTELIMKPERYMKTIRFKKESVRYIEKLGSVVAIFENEPENINLLFSYFHESLPFFLETEHKPNAPPVEKGIFHIINFLRDENDND